MIVNVQGDVENASDFCQIRQKFVQINLSTGLKLCQANIMQFREGQKKSSTQGAVIV